MEYFWGASLYHLEDLPFPTKNLPEVFSEFRKQVERYVMVREPIPAPTVIKVPEQVNEGNIPCLSDFNLKEPPNDERTVLRFTGGETTAHDRMQHYFYKVDGIRHYKDSRNGLTGSNYSSKLAPWLANGCISPRTIFKEVLRYESLRGSNESTRWLLVELMWRDYFRLIARKHANNIFKPGGIKQALVKMVDDPLLFEKWRTGSTGIPFIDANMQELLQTGYMSSRGRQNVASFLVKDLGLNWVSGADWFESQLIDYDPASNWGNWNYVAGVGNDPREGRYFNPIKQAREYDPDGFFVKTWLPALRNIPANKVHTPWLLNPEDSNKYQFVPGVNYPLPLVEPFGKAVTR
jgi:deoxyribodipyrimidine photo-lyase